MFGMLIFRICVGVVREMAEGEKARIIYTLHIRQERCKVNHFNIPDVIDISLFPDS